MLGVDVRPGHASNNNSTHSRSNANANQSPRQQLPLTPPAPTPPSVSSADSEGEGSQENGSSVNVTKSSCSDFFTAEFEINALGTPTRNFLSKGEVQDEISQESGTSVSIRGRYISLEGETPVITHPRPLYLYIQGKTEKSVLLAIDKINEIIAKNSYQLETDDEDTRKIDRMTKFNNRPPPAMAPQQNANSQQKSTFAEKLMIGLEHAPPTFNLREQVIGAGGANLNYIRNETGAVATLRGRGSLFVDPSLGTESPEPLHLYIEHYRYEGLQAAKQLAKNLIETLQQELVHFQQLNQNTQNVTFSSAGAIIPQGQHVPQINVPPPMLAVPPPQIIQQNTIDTQNNQTAVMQPNFIQQNPPPTMNAPPQTVQSSQQTVIHQQIIPQTVPIQLQQGNMVIQQQVQPPPTIGNVNIPPPGIPIPIKAGQIVQFQQPPPPAGASHLTQPPPNVQIQHPQQATQIVLNPAQNYQYQYIQQPVQTGETQMQPNQVTIQHIYQPQQQIQGIMQAAPSQSQAQTIDQFQQMRSQQFQSAPSQQYITVQGSTAYMVPPPTIIHQQQPSQPQQTQSVSAQITTSNPNIIIQPPPQLQSMQMQMQPTIAVQNLPPSPAVQQQPPAMQEQVSQTNGTDDINRSSPKEENKVGSDSDENSRKTPDEKSENDCQTNDGSGDNSIQSPITSTALALPPPPPPPTQNPPQSITIRPPPPQHLTSITLPAAQVPPPMMAVPPPMTCVQHLVGNTLITTHPQTQTHTNQIYNQVPVSIHQIQPTAQQIHVSTPSGQHFVVNATPQWQSGPPPTAQLTQQHQMQQISSNGTIQNVQITHQQIASTGTDFRTIPPPGSAPSTQGTTQQQSIMALNPQVQVQFQPQMLQQFPPPHTIESAQINIGQVSQPPPQFNVVQSQPPNLHLPPGAYQQSQNTIMTSFPQQIKQFTDQPPRFGNKRKLDEEDGGPPNHQPRMGMGPRDQQNSNQNMMPSTSQGQQQMQPPTPSHSSAASIGAPPLASSVGGLANSSLNKGADESSGPKHQQNRSGVLHQHQQHLMHNQPPPPPPPILNSSQYHHHQDNRSMYKRDGSDSHMDGHPQRPPQFEGPPTGMAAGPPPHGPGPRGPRFHHGNGMMGPGPGFAIRPPHHMQDGGGGNFPMHRMNFGPPPPPPPYRGDCPPNMGGGYGPPPPRFRGQW